MSEQSPFSDGIGVAIQYIQRDIAEIKERLDQNYVLREEFAPVKNVVYGLVGLILSAVVGGLIALIVQ